MLPLPLRTNSLVAFHPGGHVDSGTEYQAAFSQLVFARIQPTAAAQETLNDVPLLFAQKLSKLSAAYPGRVCLCCLYIEIYRVFRVGAQNYRQHTLLHSSALIGLVISSNIYIYLSIYPVAADDSSGVAEHGGRVTQSTARCVQRSAFLITAFSILPSSFFIPHDFFISFMPIPRILST